MTAYFVLGKGGVGRTSVSAALGKSFADKGEKVLIVQWALQDAIGPRYGFAHCGHFATLLEENLWTMNFSQDEAIREYFVDHLKQKMLYKLVIENRHVQRLLQAAPGVGELFFLGRLYWLMYLAKSEGRTHFDKVIVDAPATGHGVSLLTVAQTIAQVGLVGPLKNECERVSKMLADKDMVKTVFVTLPEELPVEESLEFIPKVQNHLGRDVDKVVINRSVSRLVPEPISILKDGLVSYKAQLTTDDARTGVDILVGDLERRVYFEKVFTGRLSELSKAEVTLINDLEVSNTSTSSLSVIQEASKLF